MLLNASQTRRPFLVLPAMHGWIPANPVKPDSEKEGEEFHSQIKLNQTQYNPVSTPQWWVEGKGREHINQALSPLQVTPGKTDLHCGEAEVLNWAQDGSFSCNVIKTAQSNRKWKNSAIEDMEHKKEWVKTEHGSK